MIDPGHPRLSIVRQCELVSISRSSFYREPAPESAENLKLMRLIDEQFLETPYYGSRQMARHLRRQGYNIGRKHVQRLMRKMGISAIYQAPKTAAPPRAQDLSVLAARPEDRASQSRLVRRHHLHPDAPGLFVPGGHHGLGDAQRALFALRTRWTRASASRRSKKPSRASASQRSSILTKGVNLRATNSPSSSKRGIRISMDGKGRWMDNVFIERLWRSLKYECVYLTIPRPEAKRESGSAAGSITTTPTDRTRRSPDRTPDEAYAIDRQARRNWRRNQTPNPP